MSYWITTDTHFNHQMLIDIKSRPANFEMIIKKRLIELIKPEDILIHLGDVCIGNDKENNQWFKDNLKCKTILVKGNHDHKSYSWYLKNGWDFVCERFDLDMYGKRYCFTHKPVPWDGEFNVNVHGHFHNTDHRRFDPQFNKILSGYNKLIALENNNYKPVNLKTL